MGWIIDLVLAGVIALVIFISYKKGIVSTVIDLVAGIAAFAIAKIIAPVAAEGVYNGIVKQIAIDFLTEKYNGIESSIAGAFSNAAASLDFLPEGMLSYIESAGLLDTDALAAGLLSEITTVAQLEEKFVAPVVIAILNLLCFAVISVLLVIALKFVGKFVSRFVTSFKFTGKIDKTVGAVFGLLKGALYAFIIAAVISVVSFASESMAVFAADSYFCSLASALIGF